LEGVKLQNMPIKDDNTVESKQVLIDVDKLEINETTNV
jgi:hypothetical protein